MSNERILVVDDDASIRRVIHACLASAGYRVEEASDGAQALDAMASRRPDLVLLDLSMPVLDGMTVLAEIRAMLGGGGAATPTIAMTAHGSARLAARAAQLGAADVLEKPLTPAELRASVAGALAGGAGEAEVSPFFAAVRVARDALRRGKFFTAEVALAKAALIDDRDPVYLNLAGVLHEGHGRLEEARDSYAAALAADESFDAPRSNLKRLAQIAQTGSTRLEPALGDEAVW